MFAVNDRMLQNEAALAPINALFDSPGKQASTDHGPRRAENEA